MNFIGQGLIEVHLIVFAALIYLAICIDLHSSLAPPSPQHLGLFTCRLCDQSGPRSAESNFYRFGKSRATYDVTSTIIAGGRIYQNVYSRAHLLAVRRQLAGRRGGLPDDGRVDRAPRDILRDLPDRLSHLVRRGRGMRAGAHSRRPISVICSTRRATNQPSPRDRHRMLRNKGGDHEPCRGSDASMRARFLAYPERMSARQTLQLQRPVTNLQTESAVPCPEPSELSGLTTHPIPVVTPYRPAVYRRSQKTNRKRNIIDVATVQQCRPQLPVLSNGAADETVNISRPLLTIQLLNIQSLLPKMPDILADVSTNGPDILCYTETNLKVTTPDRFVTIPGYTVHRSDRITGRKKSGGGVSIYVKANMETSMIMKTSNRTSHVEHIWVKSKISERRSVIIGCIYRPPATSVTQVDTDFDEIEEQIQTVISKYAGCPLIITGDFNADRDTNPAGAQRLEKLANYGLKIMIDVPTFYRGTTQTVLDNILLSDSLANDDLHPEHAVQRCDYTSHHHKVTMKMHVTRSRTKAMFKTGRCWRRLCNNDLLTDLRKVNWDLEVPRGRTCEEQWATFRAIFWSILDKHVPARSMKVRNPRPPPLSDETIELITDRRIAKAVNDTKRYHQLNAKTKQAIRRDLRDDISYRIEQAGPSKLWQQLKPIIAPKKQQQMIPDRLSANELNNYFVSVGTDTKSSVAHDYSASGRRPLKVRLPRVHTDALNFVPVTLTELQRVISEMPNKISVIENDIPIHVLKLAFPVIGRLLLRIINCSIVSETVPDDWKRAVVIPLHKRGDATEAANYRPITNVPIMCKIIEKIIHKQLAS